MILRVLVSCGFLAAFALPGLAEQVDCANAVTQQDMNFCADQAWRLADQDLNLAYGIARSQMQQIDAALSEGDRGAELSLRTAQRAWITFRDAACDAEGFSSFGGSIRPMIVSLCLERLTRARTDDLRLFAEPN